MGAGFGLAAACSFFSVGFKVGAFVWYTYMVCIASVNTPGSGSTGIAWLGLWIFQAHDCHFLLVLF